MGEGTLVIAERRGNDGNKRDGAGEDGGKKG